MLKTLLTFLLALCVACSARAQSPQNKGPLTSTTCPGTGCLTLGVSGLSGVAFQITGTFTGTITFEVSLDGVTYVALNVTPPNSTTAVTTATAAGIWGGAVGGAAVVQARMSAYTSGTATVTIQASPMSGRGSGLGGGGGGTPGGLTTQVQFNDAGAFGGDSGLTFNKTTNVVGLLSGGGLSFAGSAAPITVTGGDDGSGDSAVIFDNSTDDFIALRFNQDGDVLGADVAAGGFGGELFMGAAGALQGGPVTLAGGFDPARGDRAKIAFTGNTSSNGATIQLQAPSSGRIRFTISSHADPASIVGTGIALGNGAALQTDTSNGSTGLLQAYDVDGAAYSTFATLTNGNTPSLSITPPAGGGTVSVTAAYTTTGTGLSVANVGANSCGTSAATIAGNSNTFEITVGATAGTQCRVTFPTAAPNRINCTVTDSTTTVATRATSVDTTHVDFLGSFVAGDVVTAICFPR